MTRLSVNVNKIATLRNARGGSTPSVVEAAIRIQSFGAQGITVHPRPDQRHITTSDVLALRPVVTTEFNLEGYPSEAFIALVCAVCPEQVTLVPDPPDALTSNAGWDVIGHQERLTEILAVFRKNGIRTSLFTSTDLRQIEAAAQVGTDRIELYTEPYALDFQQKKPESALPFSRAATLAHGLGLGVNAGHDLNLDNLRHFAENVPYLEEVSIGHALISEALYLGLEKTVAAYLQCLSMDTNQTP
tara:strand:+ start:1540 stop:2274 length:735 start_codon:yes stop_codon:yes gene_type:complete